ncbi:unnamed protein product [Trifolium pratense]|uniref:Uncharacterized protein n=1 Tax=Trifolium pratense TaxID=57577 RepID=A0ACB0LMU2_TRIPR|nr:unnamed protein product [Trifolium pratense]
MVVSLSSDHHFSASISWSPPVTVRSWVCGRRRVGLFHRRGARPRLLFSFRRSVSSSCGLLVYWSTVSYPYRFGFLVTVAGGFGFAVLVVWFIWICYLVISQICWDLQISVSRFASAALEDFQIFLKFCFNPS